MDKKSKLSKLEPARKEEAVVEANGLTAQEALDVEEAVLEEAEEMEEEDHQEHATTVIRPDTWQEIALKNDERDEVGLEVVEVAEVVVAEHATIAMKKDTWQESAQKEIGVKRVVNCSFVCT